MKILIGDCIESMKTLQEKSIQSCITSPPYYGLRDYGVDGQIGLEQSPAEYVGKLVEVFREVKRVLRDDGTLWLNLGDSYSAVHGGSHGYKDGRKNRTERKAAGVVGKQKNLLGIPWRVAFALQDDGWYLRQDIIWSKPNPMPESVRDRCTKSHEYIFLLTKSLCYYFDNDAIKEPVSESTKDRLRQNITIQKGSERVPGKTNGNMKAVGSVDKRNKRSVWTVTTRPYKGAHFATFPSALIEPCVLAGSKTGDTILDPFAGSGTVGQVAMQHGRKSILCELNPDYEQLILERIGKVA